MRRRSLAALVAAVVVAVAGAGAGGPDGKKRDGGSKGASISTFKLDL